MNIPTLVNYLLAAMNAWVPMSNHAYYEPKIQTEARYEAIANDIAVTVEDEAEESIFPEQYGGKLLTGLLLASIASFEGAYNAKVDSGLALSATYNNDNGQAVGLWQTHVYGKTHEGWTREDLATDRTKAVRVALRMARSSFSMCRKLPLADRLSGYTIGRGQCVTNRESEDRVNRAVDWWKAHRVSYVETMSASNP